MVDKNSLFVRPVLFSKRLTAKRADMSTTHVASAGCSAPAVRRNDFESVCIVNDVLDFWVVLAANWESIADSIEPS